MNGGSSHPLQVIQRRFRPAAVTRGPILTGGKQSLAVETPTVIWSHLEVSLMMI